MAEPIAPRESAPVVEPADTEVIEPAPAETLVIEVPPKKRKRRRWIGVLIGLIVLAVLLVVAFFVADGYAKTYAETYVRERIVETLKLDADARVGVDVGDGSVLLQAMRGALDQVDVDVDEVAFGDIAGSAQISATNVPLDSALPVEKLDIIVTVPGANVEKLSSFMSGLDLDSIELADELIRVTTTFKLLFLEIPISVDLEPSAKDGGISFDPVTILLGDEQISVADLRASPQFSAIAGDLLDSRDFCVASFLPEALTIDDVDVVGETLVVSIDGDGTALSDPALSELGTCPA